MNFNEYQVAVDELLLPQSRSLEYQFPALVGEVGELASLYAKGERDGINNYNEFALKIKKELGDVLFFVASIADIYGFDLEDIANTNIEKLHDRRARGKLQGSGDDR